jgi:hypothetical protein
MSIARSITNAIERQPKSLNPMQLNEYKMVLHRTPHLVYFCQAVNLPGLQSTPLSQPSPFATDIKIVPGKITHDDLTVKFIVNEDMSNWLEIYDWLKTITPINTFKNQIPPNQEQNRYSDMSIIVMNSKSSGILNFTYTNCFPISIGGLDLDSSISDINPAVASVTFGYTGFTVETMKRNY